MYDENGEEELVDVLFPFNHPGVETSGTIPDFQHYRLMYGENENDSDGEFYTDNTTAVINYEDPIFDWENENYNFSQETGDYTEEELTALRNVSGDEGYVTLFIGNRWSELEQTGYQGSSLSKIDFSEVINYQTTYAHNVISFLPHMKDQDVIADNDGYREFDYWFIVGDEVSENNTIKYTKTWRDEYTETGYTYYAKLYVASGEQISINSTDIKTISLFDSDGNAKYYLEADVNTFEHNMLFEVIDAGQEQIVIDEGNVAEFEFRILNPIDSTDPNTSYITYTTIDANGTKHYYCIWFKANANHSEPNLDTFDIQYNYIPIEVDGTGENTKNTIADLIEEALYQTGNNDGINMGTGGFVRDGLKFTFVNIGNGSLDEDEQIDTNDANSFAVSPDTVGADDTLSENLNYVNGKEEWAVKTYCDRKALSQQIDELSEDAASLEKQIMAILLLI